MMAEKSCIGLYASPLKRNKAVSDDDLVIEVLISQRLLLNHTNKIMTRPGPGPGPPKLFFSEPRRAFLSPDGRSILSTIIRGIQTPFPLQHIHWTLDKFPQESDRSHTLDEIIADGRLMDVARRCALDDRVTSMVIHLTKLEKVDEFPVQLNNKQLLQQHLADWIRENPESEARAASKCLEAMLEGESRYCYELVRSVKIMAGETIMECSICMRGFEEGKHELRMPCSHIFHGFCILKWLEKAPNCPLCRFRLC